MDQTQAVPGGPAELGDLPDLADLPLLELLRLEESALVPALRRLRSGADGQGTVSGFDSAL